MDKLRHRDRVSASAHYKGMQAAPLMLEGLIGIRHRDKHGRIISDWEWSQNTVMETWRTAVLERAYRTPQATPVFFFIPIDLTSFTAIAAADTLASHAGWLESTDYDEATRQAWTPGAAAAQSITNPTPATITATAGFTCHGLALVAENSTKGNTATGILVSAGVLAADKILAAGETLDMTYQYDI